MDANAKTACLNDIYNAIGKKFLSRVEKNRVQTDAFLTGERRDGRRGLTLLFRPAGHIVDTVMSVQDMLAPLLGPQYVQPASDLHMTVFSVMPAVPTYADFEPILHETIEAVDGAVALANTEIGLDIRGIVASDEAIMTKGFPIDSALQDLRARVLSALEEIGLEERVKRRYTITTAHMTIVRFTKQIPDLKALAVALDRQSETPIGRMHADRLELVEHDWYMRNANLNPVRDWQLMPNVGGNKT